MAITIDSAPSNQFHLAYRPVVWTVSSNDANIVRCIADIYIEGVYSVTLEKSPDIGTTDTFTFDFQSVLQDNLASHVPNFTDNSQTLVVLDSVINYLPVFYEVLDNGTTYDTSWAENGAGSSGTSASGFYTPNLIQAINGTLRHEETQDLTVFEDNGTYGTLSRGFKPTTTYDGASCNVVKSTRIGDFIPINGYRYSAITMRGKLIQYDSSDTGISTTYAGSITSSYVGWLYYIDTSILASNCAKILARIETTGASATTSYVHYKIVSDCDDYVSLYWQNSLGGIDYYLFRDGQVRAVEGNTTTFVKPLTTSYNVYDFGETVLNKSGRWSINANSEVLSRTDADWLSELSTHAVRAWVYVDSKFIPVIISDVKMETINTFDGTYRINIELLYSNKTIAQRY